MKLFLVLFFFVGILLGCGRLKEGAVNDGSEYCCSDPEEMVFHTSGSSQKVAVTDVKEVDVEIFPTLSPPEGGQNRMVTGDSIKRMLLQLSLNHPQRSYIANPIQSGTMTIRYLDSSNNEKEEVLAIQNGTYLQDPFHPEFVYQTHRELDANWLGNF